MPRRNFRILKTSPYFTLFCGLVLLSSLLLLLLSIGHTSCLAASEALKPTNTEQVDPLSPDSSRNVGDATIQSQGTELMEGEAEGIESEQVVPLEDEVLGLAATNLSPMKLIVQQAAKCQVIYVGEKHDRYGEHIVQLDVIRTLASEGRKLAVGMEMFQRPFQAAIDDYLSGAIDEKTFLAQTEYFERWSFNYRLYRSIVEFCKEQGLPLVALNLSSEIPRKVAREGLGSLTDAEREQIPQDLDTSNTSYRARLKEVFEQHPESDVENFENFYNAQILWDETMAETVHAFLRTHPDYQMVVLAGSGHLAYGDGIPDRVRKRGGYEQAIIFNVSGEELTPELADYFLFPADVPPPVTARLGVYLEEGEAGLLIGRVAPNSPAQRSGLRKGDILLALDGEPVETVSDLKLALFFKEEGDTARVRVKRIRRMARDKVLEVTVDPFQDRSAARHAMHRRPATQPLEKDGQKQQDASVSEEEAGAKAPK